MLTMPKADVCHCPVNTKYGLLKINIRCYFPILYTLPGKFCKTKSYELVYRTPRYRSLDLSCLAYIMES